LDDLAASESKAERNTLINCLQYGFHTELQKTAEEERPLLKTRLVQRLYNKHGTDTALYRAVLDLLEVALFGKVSGAAETVVDLSTNGSDWESAGEQGPLPQTRPSTVQSPPPVSPAPWMISPSPVVVPQPTQPVNQSQKHTVRNVLIAVIVVVVAIGIFFAIIDTYFPSAYIPPGTSSDAETLVKNGLTITWKANMTRP
jgi:hypothetical protein